MAFAAYDRILVDVSNLYYRAFFVARPPARESGGCRMSTGGILMSIKMIERLERCYMADGGRMYFLFDNAASGEERRRDIDPGYKANRKRRDPQFYRGLDCLQLILSNWKAGHRVSRRAESEADDLVAPILKSFEGKGLRVLLASNDMDWARGISDRAHWMAREGGKDVIYDKAAFALKFGFDPSADAICLFKALLGDESDNIPPGVKGMSRDDALMAMREAGSVRSLYMNLRGLGIPPALKESIRAARGRVELNERLARYAPVSIDECRESTIVAKFSRAALSRLYKALGFDPSEVDARLCERPLTEDDFFNGFGNPSAS